MRITKNNYYSSTINLNYLSNSQYKDFSGSLGKCGCEAKALAKLKNEYKEDITKELLLGSFVDSFFEGKKSFKNFVENNPEIILSSGKNKGEFKEDYKTALNSAKKAKNDSLFAKYMSGQKQKIMSANFFGANWKIKIDSYHKNNCIVDLKYIKNIHERFWVKDYGYTNFIDYWGYDIQGAIYQYVVYLNTGKLLPFYIAVIDKQKEADFEIIQIPDEHLYYALEEVKNNTNRIIQIKKEKLKPQRCEKCDYCRLTKKLKKPIHISQLIEN